MRRAAILAHLALAVSLAAPPLQAQDPSETVFREVTVRIAVTDVDSLLRSMLVSFDSGFTRADAGRLRQLVPDLRQGAVVHQAYFVKHNTELQWFEVTLFRRAPDSLGVTLRGHGSVILPLDSMLTAFRRAPARSM